MLPVGWTAHSAEDGTPYYHNAATGNSVWQYPVATSHSAAQRGGGSSSNTIFAASTASAPAAAAGLPVGWVAYSDVAGTPYYHNAATGKTMWEFPIALQPVAAAAAALTAAEFPMVRPLPGVVSYPGYDQLPPQQGGESTGEGLPQGPLREGGGGRRWSMGEEPRRRRGDNSGDGHRGGPPPRRGGSGGGGGGVQRSRSKMNGSRTPQQMRSARTNDYWYDGLYDPLSKSFVRHGPYTLNNLRTFWNERGLFWDTIILGRRTY